MRGKVFSIQFSLLVLLIANALLQFTVSTVRVNAEFSPRMRNSLVIENSSGRSSRRSSEQYVPGEVIVGVRGRLSTNSIRLIQDKGGTVIKQLSAINAVVVKTAEDRVEAFMDEMRKNSLIRYVERNGMITLDLTPNDPYWYLQWGPQTIRADLAWDTQIGSSTILVAVVDTGIDYTHDDLAANYVTGGYDWVNDDNDPMDDNGHGTHCMGIIAAELNNEIGIAGLAQVNVMAEKSLDEYGVGTFEDAVLAVTHAAEMGANIISCSWGSYVDSSAMHDAFIYAYNLGALSVASAGNDNTNEPHYPAAYPEVISVAATDSSDQKWMWSNWGDTIELAAPGVDILSASLGNSYAYKSGTSMSVPHVSGVAALIWSQFPEYTHDQVRVILRSSADDLGDPGWDQYYGFGRVNAYQAVQGLEDHDIYVTELEAPKWLIPGATIVNGTIENYGFNDEANVEVQFLVNDTVDDTTVIPSLPSATSTIVRFPWTPMIEGSYNLTIYAVPVPAENIVSNNWLYTWVMVTSTMDRLIIKDVDPWEFKSNEEICGSQDLTYAVISSAELAGTDLSIFTAVVIASDQPDHFYDTVEASLTKFEDYVNAGGILVAHACDMGWHGGFWETSFLPGAPNLGHVPKVVNDLSIVHPDHPIIDGPYGTETDDTIDGWDYSAHGYFTGLPELAQVIVGIADDPTGKPTYVEWPYGEGRVLATMMPLEWVYSHNPIQPLPQNEFAYTPPVRPTVVVSCDEDGNGKDVFYLNEDVYVKGSGFPPCKDVTIYVIPDDEAPKPDNAVTDPSTSTTDKKGKLPITLVWSAPLDLGEYDVWVDVNQNDEYDKCDVYIEKCIDVYLFMVIPELPIGSIVPVLAMIGALAVFATRKKRNILSIL